MIARGLLFLVVGTGFASVAMAEEPKVNCAKAELQIELNYCAEKALDAADAELNAQWKVTKAVAAQADGEVEKSMRGAEAALLKAQRAWIDYRDGTCEVAGFAMRGGTAEQMLIYDCQARLTRARTGELKELAAGLAGQ